MKAALRAIAPGPYVTIQDAGRRGWRRFGVSGAGAMDLGALFTANALVGNPLDAAALEFAHVGGTWEITADSCRIAVAGGTFEISADDVTLASRRSFTLRRGQRLMIKGAPDAVWGYLAVAKGFDVAAQLGSRATHLRSGLGGIEGRRISEGDTIPLRTDRAPGRGERQIARPPDDQAPIRIVLGPQADFFASDTISTFLAAKYHVTHRGDRMGVWLDGPLVAHAGDYNVLSDGLVPGCIQISGSGQPIVLLMDCQTIGGYPKLATIITADLHRFAQSRPGTVINFASVDVETAQQLYRERRAALAAVDQTVKEIPRYSARPPWLQ